MLALVGNQSRGHDTRKQKLKSGQVNRRPGALAREMGYGKSSNEEQARDPTGANRGGPVSYRIRAVRTRV
jgi:hypothetical protein